MACSVEGEGLWLPSKFLTGDDFLMDKENFKKSNNTESDSEFFFPTEFPYDFETVNDERLAKFWVMSSSSQSTSAHLGDWTGRSAGGSSSKNPNGLPSPPTTPFGAKYDAAGGLIYRAVSKVEKLKLDGGDGLGPGPAKQKGLDLPRSLPQFYQEAKNPCSSVLPNTHFQQKQQNEGCGMWYSQQQIYQNRGGKAVGGMGQAAWTLQQTATHGRAVLLGGSGRSGGDGGVAAKRVCAGTGVFLPRMYGNSNDINACLSDSRKRQDAGCSTALFPRRPAIHPPTKNLVNMDGFAHCQQQSVPCSNRGFVPDYDAFTVRRHASVATTVKFADLTGRRGSSMMSREI